jgi:hypothetical protein
MLSMLTTAVHAEVPTDTLRSMIYAYPNLPPGRLRCALKGARLRGGVLGVQVFPRPAGEYQVVVGR